MHPGWSKQPTGPKLVKPQCILSISYGTNKMRNCHMAGITIMFCYRLVVHKGQSLGVNHMSSWSAITGEFLQATLEP